MRNQLFGGVSQTVAGRSSIVIIRNKPDYYRLLQEVRTKDRWTEWVLYMLKAIEETSIGTLHLERQ
jgi:Fic family protein